MEKRAEMVRFLQLLAMAAAFNAIGFGSMAVSDLGFLLLPLVAVGIVVMVCIGLRMAAHAYPVGSDKERMLT